MTSFKDYNRIIIALVSTQEKKDQTMKYHGRSKDWPIAAETKEEQIELMSDLFAGDSGAPAEAIDHHCRILVAFAEAEMAEALLDKFKADRIPAQDVVKEVLDAARDRLAKLLVEK